MKSIISQFPKIILILITLCLSISCQKGSSNSNGDEGAETDSATARINPQRLSPQDSIVGRIEGVNIRIIYSAPAVKGRKIWGELEPYNKVWRTGANEATTIEFSEDLSFGGKIAKAGKYALFTIPRENGSWDVILNKVWDQWGAYNYDETENVLQIAVDIIELEEVMENLRFSIDESGKIVLAWEYIMLPIPVSKAGNNA